MTEDQPRVVQLADDAYQSIRAIDHIPGGPLPAPLLYSVLGNLKLVGDVLPQALSQLGNGLQQSLSAYEVYEDNPEVDPATSVTAARALLDHAGAHAARLGQLLDEAQSAIAGRGYREPIPSASEADPA